MTKVFNKSDSYCVLMMFVPSVLWPLLAFDNSEYEFYNKEDLCGVDITTVINKAMDNNEKYETSKDENGCYIPNEENSINIYVKLINNNQTYPMERIKEIGLESFVEFFGEVGFRCTKIEYHKNTGRISSMTFESLNK